MAMARFSVRERWPGTLYGRRHPFTDHVSRKVMMNMMEVQDSSLKLGFFQEMLLEMRFNFL